MASLQAELQEVKRKGEVAVTSFGSQGNCLPMLDTQLVSSIVMCTVGPLHKYLPSPSPSPLPAMFSDDHARHAT